jgi:hypothetical protein
MVTFFYLCWFTETHWCVHERVHQNQMIRFLKATEVHDYLRICNNVCAEAFGIEFIICL